MKFKELDKTMKFMAKHGLLANSLLCPNCQEKQASLVKHNDFPERSAWRCNKCRYNTGVEKSERHSVRAGSFFSNSHLSLRKIFKLIYYWCAHPKSTSEAIMNECGIGGEHTGEGKKSRV